MPSVEHIEHLVFQGSRLLYYGTIPKILNPVHALDLNHAQRLLDQLAETVAKMMSAMQHMYTLFTFVTLSYVVFNENNNLICIIHLAFNVSSMTTAQWL